MGNPGKGIQLRSSALTSVGRVRSHNEDNIHLWASDTLLLAIVADGMGGAAAGEEASRIAVETITEHLGIENQTDIPESLMRSAVKEANLSIMQEAIERPKNKGMGTTVTMTYIKGTEALFAHVGDSRAYRVDRSGDIEQITSDHSFVQALLDAGHITEEQAETHPMGNVLYRALGQTPELDVDTYRTILYDGDRLVLCSDGLTRHVRSYEIAELASKTDNPHEISRSLVDLANERGGEDNISVIVIIVEGEEDPIQRPSSKKQGSDKSVEDEDTLVIRPNSSINNNPNIASNSSSLDARARLEYYDRPRYRESRDHWPTSSWNMMHNHNSRMQSPFSGHDVEGSDKTYPNQ